MWTDWNWVLPALMVGSLSSISGALYRIARALERRNILERRSRP